MCVQGRETKAKLHPHPQEGARVSCYIPKSEIEFSPLLGFISSPSLCLPLADKSIKKVFVMVTVALLRQAQPPKIWLWTRCPADIPRSVSREMNIELL